MKMEEFKNILPVFGRSRDSDTSEPGALYVPKLFAVKVIARNEAILLNGKKVFHCTRAYKYEQIVVPNAIFRFRKSVCFIKKRFINLSFKLTASSHKQLA